MKKILTLAAAAAVLCGCADKNAYTIQGNIEGLDGMVYLFDEDDNLIDSTAVTNGSFRFSGTATAPAIYTLSDGRDMPVTFVSQLFIEPGTILVSDNEENPSRKKVTGTPANDANTALSAASMALIMEARNPETTEERGAAIEEEDEALMDST